MEGSYFAEGCRALREGMVAIADAMMVKHYAASDKTLAELNVELDAYIFKNLAYSQDHTLVSLLQRLHAAIKKVTR